MELRVLESYTGKDEYGLARHGHRIVAVRVRGGRIGRARLGDENAGQRSAAVVPDHAGDGHRLVLDCLRLGGSQYNLVVDDLVFDRKAAQHGVEHLLDGPACGSRHGGRKVDQGVVIDEMIARLAVKVVQDCPQGGILVVDLDILRKRRDYRKQQKEKNFCSFFAERHKL